MEGGFCEVRFHDSVSVRLDKSRAEGVEHIDSAAPTPNMQEGVRTIFFLPGDTPSSYELLASLPYPFNCMSASLISSAIPLWPNFSDWPMPLS